MSKINKSNEIESFYECKDAKCVLSLIEKGYDISERDNVYKSPLWFFCCYANSLNKKNRYEIIDVLLDNGADIDQPAYVEGIGMSNILFNIDDYRIMKIILNKCKIDLNSRRYKRVIDTVTDMRMIRFLLSHGANIIGKKPYDDSFKMEENGEKYSTFSLKYNCSGKENRYIRIPNSVEDKPKCVEELIRDWVPDDYKNSKNILHNQNNIHVIDYFLEKGADVNSQDEKGNTALYLAIFDIEVVKHLLKNKAGPNIKNKKGRTVMHNMIPDMVNHHIDEDYLETFKLLIKNKADPHVKDNQGNTIYHYMATNIFQDEEQIEEYHETIMKYIDVEVKNNEGRTVLHQYIIDGMYDNESYSLFILYLIKLGADINSQDNEGNTPFHNLDLSELIGRYNIDYPSDKYVYAFIDLLFYVIGLADVNIRNNKGQTCLHSFLLKEDFLPIHLGVAVEFIKYGADVNTQDNEGNTPLHTINDYYLISLLLSYGADVLIKNKEGKTGLDNDFVKEQIDRKEKNLTS